jgi:hypothetical protein
MKPCDISPNHNDISIKFLGGGKSCAVAINSSSLRAASPRASTTRIASTSRWNCWFLRLRSRSHVRILKATATLRPGRRARLWRLALMAYIERQRRNTLTLSVKATARRSRCPRPVPVSSGVFTRLRCLRPAPIDTHRQVRNSRTRLLIRRPLGKPRLRVAVRDEDMHAIQVGEHPALHIVLIQVLDSQPRPHDPVSQQTPCQGRSCGVRTVMLGSEPGVATHRRAQPSGLSRLHMEQMKHQAAQTRRKPGRSDDLRQPPDAINRAN